MCVSVQPGWWKGVPAPTHPTAGVTGKGDCGVCALSTQQMPPPPTKGTQPQPFASLCPTPPAPPALTWYASVTFTPLSRSSLISSWLRPTSSGLSLRR